MNDKLPKHVAIILDGNGRWAKSKMMPRTYGHSKGVDNLIKIVKHADKKGIKNLTVFAFSTENWDRPKKEVDFLMELLSKNLRKFSDSKSNIRMKVIGEKNNLSSKVLKSIEDIELKTKDNKGMMLNIAFNYGSKQEIVNSVNEIINKNEIINIENIQKHLYTNHSGDVDLLIRTSGEQRISNFLLWQIAYSELYFPTCHWPAFNEKEFDKAIDSYLKRDRRFGKVK